MDNAEDGDMVLHSFAGPSRTQTPVVLIRGVPFASFIVALIFIMRPFFSNSSVSMPTSPGHGTGLRNLDSSEDVTFQQLFPMSWRLTREFGLLYTILIHHHEISKSFVHECEQCTAVTSGCKSRETVAERHERNGLFDACIGGCFGVQFEPVVYAIILANSLSIEPIRVTTGGMFPAPRSFADFPFGRFKIWRGPFDGRKSFEMRWRGRHSGGSEVVRGERGPKHHAL
jgi:hypothetical protein